MRIVPKGQLVEALAVSSNTTGTEEATKPTVSNQSAPQPIVEKQNIAIDEQEITKEKLQQAVETVNEFLQINHSSSKFVLHDGLERYFVQVVDAQTEEVVKEIPPRKLLDAFYEMQKLLGMIVDEKI
ncbi:flagellar protein FlaG [Lysinibacillus sp. G4S2]|uniref:flagellar protein FlaG n=1 Tax=Lysinibacillus sp. G4S2 TaxID=3055859 RepID=UPI0025A1546B|nr:flagellar protein FlaG [Lysinibacillus sp. G4S2]MDM5246506.1 flagellar protein FlaG [Lysinibacillus sp. G4S2]